MFAEDNPTTFDKAKFTDAVYDAHSKKAEAALVIEVEEEGEGEDQAADRAATTTTDDVCKRRTKDCQIAAAR
jgi:hypothetical protein